jgi:hypothetical protein
MQDEISIEEILKWPEMEDIRAELDDPRFLTRSHGSRSTYALKCHGTLCKYAERVRGRKRTEQKAVNEGRRVQLRGRMYDRDALIEAIIVWHKKEMALRRLEDAS